MATQQTGEHGWLERIPQPALVLDLKSGAILAANMSANEQLLPVGQGTDGVTILDLTNPLEVLGDWEDLVGRLGKETPVSIPFKSARDGWDGGQQLLLKRVEEGETCYVVCVLEGVRASGERDLAEALPGHMRLVTGTPFFRGLVQCIAGVTGADYVHVAVLEGDAEGDAEGRLRTLAVWKDGDWIDNFTFEVRDTPCGAVLKGRVRCIQHGVLERFPQDMQLRELGAESYLAEPLMSSQKRPVGLITLIKRTAIREDEALNTLLGILAERASLELDRYKAEKDLLAQATRLKYALEGARVGVWDWESGQETLQISPEWHQWLGVERRLVGGLHALMSRWMLDEDLPELAQAVKRCETGEIAWFELEVRIRAASGDQRWVALSGRVTERTRTGGMARMVGAVVDITGSRQAKQRLLEERALLRRLIDSMPDMIFFKDVHGVFLGCNRAFERLTGTRESELVGKTDHDLLPEEKAAEFLAQDVATMGSGQPRATDEWVIRPDGRRCLLETTKMPYKAPDGTQIGVIGIMRDITERRRSAEAVEEERAFLQAIIDAIPEPIVVVEPDFKVKLLNAKAAAESAVDPSDASYPCYVLTHGIGAPCEDFDQSCPLQDVRKTGKPVTVEHLQKQPDGSSMVVEITAAPIFDREGTLQGIVHSTRDITERKAAQEKIEFLAHHDALTGLPNRILLRDRFEQAIIQARRSEAHVALFYLDLDNFKNINDTLGHHVGDRLLQGVVSRIESAVRDSDTVSRQGGDEFLIVVRDIKQPEVTSGVAQKILRRLDDPFDLEGQTLHTSFSIGISLFPEDGDDFDLLLQKADTAMYSAKEAGRNTYRFFTDGMNVEVFERLQMQNRLRRAFEDEEFLLYYQPQVDLATGRVIGAEALLRWRTAEFGMVPPNRFIPAAEHSGLIVQMGEWVLKEACRQVVAWQESGVGRIPVAVNLSAVQFKRSDLVETVSQVLTESGIEPALLELELTESIMLQDTEGVLATVQRLKDLGVMLSIDDFGTGYSSLAYLKRFALDKLKIDQSFIRDMETDQDSAAIVRAVIQLARSMKLKTIAEGVETAVQVAMLRQEDCDEAQGYFYFRPLPGEALAEQVRTGQLQLLNHQEDEVQGKGSAASSPKK